MAIEMEVVKRDFPLRAPFSITGHTFYTQHVVWVHLREGGYQGRGEASGVYYLGDTQDTMVDQLRGIKSAVEGGASRADIQKLLPPGGARNALDCAMWDLECKRQGARIWELVGFSPEPLITVATIGIGTVDEMARRAIEYTEFSKLKVKLDADAPLAKLRAIREARPDADIVIDVNQGWSREILIDALPELVDLQIAMVEQPLPRGEDDDLVGVDSPIPLGADESLLHLGEYSEIAPLYDVINIKLDKCGGLTEGLEIAKQAVSDGKKVMVGNMTGTSLSMAPSYVVGQLCQFVDIDGPILLERDIEHGLEYQPGGVVAAPSAELWG